jgi:hypothetical protein
MKFYIYLMIELVYHKYSLSKSFLIQFFYISLEKWDFLFPVVLLVSSSPNLTLLFISLLHLIKSKPPLLLIFFNFFIPANSQKFD